ncbi:lysine transporter LysE, partial [Vibrio cholerae]
MTLTVWLSLFTICILGAMSPGPSLAMVAKHSLAGGRKNGLA